MIKKKPVDHATLQHQIDFYKTKIEQSPPKSAILIEDDYFVPFETAQSQPRRSDVPCKLRELEA